MSRPVGHLWRCAILLCRYVTLETLRSKFEFSFVAPIHFLQKQLGEVDRISSKFILCDHVRNSHDHSVVQSDWNSYLAPFCWHNKDTCEKVACDHALPMSLLCLSWEEGLDTFIYKITGKKARILKVLYDWFRLDTVRLTRSPVLIDWTLGFDVPFFYELSYQKNTIKMIIIIIIIIINIIMITIIIIIIMPDRQ